MFRTITLFLFLCTSLFSQALTDSTRELVIYPLKPGTFVTIDGVVTTPTSEYHYLVSSGQNHTVELSKYGTPYFYGTIPSSRDTVDYRLPKRSLTVRSELTYTDLQFKSPKIWWGLVGITAGYLATGAGVYILSDVSGWDDTGYIPGMLLFAGGSTASGAALISVQRQRREIIDQGTYSTQLDQIATATSIGTVSGIAMGVGSTIALSFLDEKALPFLIAGFSTAYLSQLAFAVAVNHFATIPEELTSRPVSVTPYVSLNGSAGISVCILL